MKTHSANDSTTFPAIGDHVASTGAYPATRDAVNLHTTSSICRPLLKTCVQRIAETLGWMSVLVVTSQRLVDELLPML